MKQLPIESHLILQHYGNGIAIGIAGTPDEINRIANGLYFSAATESEPHFMSDNFAYVLSDEERLTRYYSLKIAARLKREGRLPTWKKSVAAAIPQAKKAYASLKWEDFLPKVVPLPPFSLGRISPGSPEE